MNSTKVSWNREGMRIGNVGAEIVEVRRQRLRDGPFELLDKPHVEVSTHGAQTATMAVLVEDAIAFRLRLRLPFGRAGARVHHPVLPRMRRCGSVPAAEDWTAGPRSDLAAEAHFAMPPGGQPFGLFPSAAFFLPGLSFLIGAASEARARMAMRWRAEDSDVLVDLEWRPGNAAACPASWSEEVYLEQGSEIKPLFDGYARFLEGILGSRPSGDLGLMWGSWNDGLYRNIDRERILATAQWLKNNAPDVRWVQIDDGWASAEGMSHFGVFHDPETLKGDPRFPGGMGELAHQIRAVGIRPAIWLTPAVDASCKLFRDHPDWFQPQTRLYFMPELRFLDTSLPEVRDYIGRAFDLVFGQWGFEGCKLDFWTMGFDQNDISFRNPATSGVEERRWFVDSIRARLPDDGLLLHCIDIPFGSPFLGLRFDAFRYYTDSESSCRSLEAMKEQAFWAAYLVGLYGVQRFWLPDGDGMGRFGHFEMPDRHFGLWLSFLVGSGTLLETAGWLHEGPEDPRIEMLKRALPYASAPRNVLLPDFDFGGESGEPPVIWVRELPDGRRLVALTNWGARERTFRPAELGFDADAMDILTGNRLSLDREIHVPAESGMVYVASLMRAAPPSR